MDAVTLAAAQAFTKKRTPTTPVVVAGSTAAAGANQAAIAAALAAGGDIVIRANGTVWLTGTLAIPSKTRVVVSSTCTLMLVGGGATAPIWVNAAAFSATAAVTSFTCATYLPENGATTGIITVASHSLTVNDWVFIDGATTSGYNGVFRVTATTATTLTVQMFVHPAATSATGTMVFRKADHDISLAGGAYSPNATGTTANGTYNDCCAIFQGVANLTVADATFRDAYKYGLLLGGATNFEGRNLRMENTQGGSDGLHFGGSIVSARVNGLTGFSGDDFCSLTIGDYAQFQVARGDIHDVAVSNIDCEWTPKNIAKLVGATPFYHRKITFDGVSGNCQGSGLQIYDDTVGGNLTGTQGDNIVLRNVAVACGSSVLLYTPTGSFSSILVDGIDLDVLSGTTRDVITLGRSLSTPCPFGRITVRRATGTRAALNNVNLVRVYTGVTGTRLTVEDCDVLGATAVVGIFHNGGTLKEVIVSRCRFDTVTEVYRQNTTTVGDGTVFSIDSTYLTNCTRISEFQAAGNVFVGGGVSCVSMGSNPFKASAAGKRVTYHGGPMFCNLGIDVGASGNTVDIRGHLRAPGGAVTAPTAGTTFYNTDSAWASGTGTDKSGMYGYNGTTLNTFTKLYGPA